MKRFLFQGDSITDAQRNKNIDNIPNYEIGNGYATVVAASLGVRHHGKLEFFNRGISGNRVVDLYARIKKDIINLKPDYLSILIGVNDVWHELENQNGVSAEKFELIYSMLIEEIKEELHDVKIYILEPFLTHGEAVDNRWEVFRSEVEKRAAASKKIAEKYNLTFIPLQEKFDDACKNAPCTYWTKEGVHPTAMGHGIIASSLTQAVEKDI